MGRIIGIRHRRKKTAEGEARPTMVAIKTGGGKPACHELETETDELDFLLRRFPVGWKPADENKDVEWFDNEHPYGIRPRHCKWKKVSREDVVSVKVNHIRQISDERGNPIYYRLEKVPSKFEGLQNGDKVAMVLGGSGDRFASALSRQGEEIGAEVFRLPPFSLQNLRGERSKDDDHLTLLEALEQNPKLFYKLGPKDRAIIRVKEALMLRMDAMKARIGCEQRIYQSLVGRIFLSPEGKYPEGLIEDQYDQIKASDTILLGLVAEEERRNNDLKNAVRETDVWQKVFEPIEGCGERIAAGLIAAIGSPERFFVQPNFDGANFPEERQRRKNKALEKGAAKLIKFCGVHVLPDGKFPRRRAGEVAGWSPEARQSLYLLADQFNRRPGSHWGARLLEIKQSFRQRHPEPVEVESANSKNGGTVKKKVMRYTDGHILKMAKWRALTRFVRCLYKQWVRIENENQE